jgi:uncharacterized membrane protein
MLNNEYMAAGFFTAGTISAFHFQDIVLALILGFAGAAGGWLFKKIKDKIKQFKK